jgi:glutamine amidotransferase
MISIIDYGAGNLRSVEKAVKYLGYDCEITCDKDIILASDRVILPGVGAFGDAMEKLHTYGLVEVIHECVKKEIPFLGICLGLQLMFESSEESPGVPGLGIFKGECRRFETKPGFKVPQIGWNDLTFPKQSRLLAGIPEGSFVYFVHSFYLQAGDPTDVAARTEYGVSIDAAVERGNLFACQFHPEKSERVGMQILRNFLDL